MPAFGEWHYFSPPSGDERGWKFINLEWRMNPFFRTFLRRALSVSFSGILLVWGTARSAQNEDREIRIQPNRFQAVRFDPSYYYNLTLRPKPLCNRLAATWRDVRLNHVYAKVYDPVNGAVYRTGYSSNVQTDYGDLDLLKWLIEACSLASSFRFL